MKPVDDIVADFAAHAPSASLFSDFDGTLAAIVDDPAAARPCPVPPTCWRRWPAATPWWE